MAEYRVPGLNIAVINHGEVEWAWGYGVLEAGRTEQVAAFAQPLHSELTFTRDGAGKITGAILRQEEQETPARKV
jgi:hypothetical protein